MKNKNKSKKVQKYIAQTKKVIMSHGKSSRELRMERQEADRRKRAKEMAKMDAIDKDIFKTVMPTRPIGLKQTAIPKGADAKSILCQFFKAGACTKGRKCKFSHDLSIERKVVKKSIYQDDRDKDTMENWDQNKLESVVNSNQQNKKKTNETSIICKYFLEALETKKYGWFWKCPNGNKECIYRHALPPGYVLKRDMPKEQEDDDEIPLAEIIEEKRKQLDYTTCTPLTLEVFLKWKEERKKKDEEALKAEIAKATKGNSKSNKNKKSRALQMLSGRALFEYDDTLFADDDDAASDLEIQSDQEEEEENDHQVTEQLKEQVQDLSLFDDDEDLPSDDDDDDE